jgi:hypothetical protein
MPVAAIKATHVPLSRVQKGEDLAGIGRVVAARAAAGREESPASLRGITQQEIADQAVISFELRR